MALLVPIYMVGVHFFQKWDTEIQEARDKRVKLLGEVLSGIKNIKSLGWEPQLAEKIGRSRDGELGFVGKFQYLIASYMLLFTLSPTLIKVASIALYTWHHPELSASQAFYIIILLDMLSEPMQSIGIVMQLFVSLRVSMRRIESFLCAGEVEELSPAPAAVGHSVIKKEEAPVSRGVYSRTMVLAPGASEVLRMDAACFRWREGKSSKVEQRDKLKIEKSAAEKVAAKGPEVAGEESWAAAKSKSELLATQIAQLQAQIDLCGDKALLPTTGPPTLFVPELVLQKGNLVAVVGPVGTGKSTLLAGALNEVDLESGAVSLNGTVAFCASEPWIIHGTVRENIVMEREWNESRYRIAIECTALAEDILQLSGGRGDQTEIGEKGLNLSGGQKARIGLARAVYADADVYILDDVIAAVEEYVKLHHLKPINYNIETKCSPATDGISHPAPEEFVALLVDVIAKGNVSKRTTIQSFDKRSLQVLHQSFPSIKTSYLIDGTNKKTPEELIAELGFQPSFLSPAYAIINKEYIEACKKLKLKLIAWTVNEEKDIKKMAALGVDGIISDYPDRFSVLKNR